MKKSLDLTNKHAVLITTMNNRVICPMVFDAKNRYITLQSELGRKISDYFMRLYPILFLSIRKLDRYGKFTIEEKQAIYKLFNNSTVYDYVRC